MPHDTGLSGHRTTGRSFGPSLLDALPLAAVLAIHLAAWIVMSRPIGPWRTHRMDMETVTDVLRVRWISRPATRRAARRHTTAAASVVTVRARAVHSTPGRPATTAAPSTGTIVEGATRPLDLALPPPATSGYVPGAGRLHAADAPLPQLPGEVDGAHGAVFRMIDPRTRGMAGLVRRIGALTGAVDPGCLRLQTWRGMSLGERVARGVTDRDMQRLAREHGCGVGARFVGPGTDPLRTPPPGR